MKNLIIGLCFLLLSVTAYSQAATDSIYLYQQSYQDLQFSKNAPLQLLAFPVERASKVQLQLQGFNGGYRTAQTAQRTTIADFSAEGIATLNRFKVSGYFSYGRTSEDSLAWNQQGLPGEDRPYYFASAKAGPYLRDQYHMGGQLAYNVYHNKWFIGGGIDYVYNTATRSVDPRPLVRTFSLMLKPELVYKWKQHFVGIGLTWGTGYEDNGISYANSSYQQNTSEQYKDWITYMVTGYGSAYPQRSDLSIIRHQRYKGLNFNYSGSLQNWDIKLMASYLLTEEMNKISLLNSLNSNNISNYQVEGLRAKLLVSKKTAKMRQQIRLDFQSNDGSGYYNRIGAKNYYMNHKTYEACYSLLFSKFKKLSPEFRMGAGYEDLSRRDLSVYASNHYAWVQPYIGGTIYDHVNEGNLLSLAVDAAGFIPVKNKLVAPEATVTEFTKGVVYPDYYYYKSLGATLKGRVNYITSSLVKGYHAGISAQVQFSRKLSSPEVTLPAYFIADHNRLSYSVSLNLYF